MQYDLVESISFDTVIERMQRGRVYHYEGQWQDIGSWNRLAGKLTTEQIGIGSTAIFIAGYGNKFVRPFAEMDEVNPMPAYSNLNFLWNITEDYS